MFESYAPKFIRLMIDTPAHKCENAAIEAKLLNEVQTLMENCSECLDFICS